MPPDKPLVSVLTITYNHEKYIRAALESILMQRAGFVYEAVVSDDCSTDATPLILKEYAAKYPGVFHLILREKNVGMKLNASGARKMCRGKYIAPLDGDDYWTDPLKLQKQVDFMESHPEYSGCAHEVQFVDEEGKPVRGFNNRGRYTAGRVCSLADIKADRLAGQSSSFLYKNVFLSLTKRQDDDYCACDCASDLKLMLLLTLHGPMYRLDEVMSAHRFVIKKGAGTWSSYSYNNNLSLTYLHWADECTKMAEKAFGRKAEFKGLLINAVYNAWAKLLLHPSSENLGIFVKVFKESKYKGRALLRIITGTAAYPWHALKRRLG